MVLLQGRTSSGYVELAVRGEGQFEDRPTVQLYAIGQVGRHERLGRRTEGETGVVGHVEPTAAIAGVADPDDNCLRVLRVHRDVRTDVQAVRRRICRDLPGRLDNGSR